MLMRQASVNSCIANIFRLLGQWISTFSVLFYILKLHDIINAEILAIHVVLNKTCDDWASLNWNQKPQFLRETSRCQLTTVALKTNSTEIQSIYPRDYQYYQELKLTKLKENSPYMFYMRCDRVYLSNNVSFVTGSKCHTYEDDSTPYFVKEPEMAVEIPVSLSDIVLGTVFALVGLIIICVFLYHFWKSYVRRQRINRIFREVETDPFTYLQNHMEEQSAVNL
ncbi:hypothetical protein SNE40_012257 [Patella caerulea]|uniref:Uncharacterized protein n=1 Tax=Patella caerulea TaxID=87958 RepID=A0AAN8JPJ0_PATCE